MYVSVIIYIYIMIMIRLIVILEIFGVTQKLQSQELLNVPSNPTVRQTQMGVGCCIPRIGCCIPNDIPRDLI